MPWVKMKKGSGLKGRRSSVVFSDGHSQTAGLLRAFSALVPFFRQTQGIGPASALGCFRRPFGPELWQVWEMRWVCAVFECHASDFCRALEFRLWIGSRLGPGR